MGLLRLVAPYEPPCHCCTSRAFCHRLSVEKGRYIYIDTEAAGFFSIISINNYIPATETKEQRTRSHTKNKTAKMQFLSLLTTAALAAALPQPQTATTDPTTGLPTGYYWSVYDWQAGCASSGCSYNFNVTGVQDGLYPGFLAYCNGYDTGFYGQCQILNATSTSGIPFVSASLQPSKQDGVAKMSVSLEFVDSASK